MKYYFIFITVLISHLASAQSKLPEFLHGSWRVENKEMYEHWDKLNDNNMKGFSFQLKEGQMAITEYIDIMRKEDKIIYTANVINQNNGREIPFYLIKTDSTYTFENLNHDFPKRVIYKRLSESEVLVNVSDGGRKRFSYKMIRQDGGKPMKDATSANPDYSRDLAEKWGADDYGMKAYIFVILKTGTNQSTDQSFINETFKGHLNNIRKLVDEGKLIVAGPFDRNDQNYRGIFILDNITTATEAKELLQTDPAIQSGLLDFDLYSWYGSAALPAYIPISEKIWKLKP